jgi:inorganic pyrophosphatase
MAQERRRHGLEVMIEAVGAESYCYAYDSLADAIRLEGTVSSESGWPGDLGILPDTLAPDAQPVQVLVLGTHPTFPGCRVEAAPVGLLEGGLARDRQCLVLAVPTADAARATILDASDLPADLSRALEAGARMKMRATGGQAGALRWSGAEEAQSYVHEARQAYRLMTAQREHAGLGGPAWEVRDRALRRTGTSEAELYTEAEYTVYALPYRFQKYARECLLPTERLLQFALRSPVRYGGRLGLGNRRVAHEALVVVTDQQVLLLADALPPDATLVHWGYIARATPLERVLHVGVRKDNQLVWLELAVETAAGPGAFRVEFAAEQESVARALADTIRAFCPAANLRRLLRRYSVARSDEPLAVEAFVSGEIVAALEARLNERLEPDEPVLARAIAPAGTSTSAPVQLLAATSRRVLIESAPAPRQAGGPPGELRLNVLAAVEIQNALIGGRFRLWVGGAGADRPLEIAFPYPVVNAFQALYLTVRQLLATPPAAPVLVAPAQGDNFDDGTPASSVLADANRLAG